MGDVLVVVGSATSSNSNRLVEIGARRGVAAHRVDGAEDLRREWFDGRQSVGVTAGASAPELLVKQVVAQLVEWGAEAPVEAAGRTETVVFGLPRQLRGNSPAS